MNLCSCPASSALASIPSVSCPESFGQIQKVIFQRLQKTPGVDNSFTGTNQIGKLASWTPLLTASDGTKVVVSPFINAPTDGGGDAITFGSGNDVLGGVAEVIGSNPVTFSAVIRHCPQEAIAALKALICESRSNNLGVYLVSENGQIECLKDGEAYKPIPVQSFFVGDKIHGGFDAYDSNSISWSYPPNYSDKLTIVTPEFNPLSALVTE